MKWERIGGTLELKGDLFTLRIVESYKHINTVDNPIYLIYLNGEYVYTKDDFVSEEKAKDYAIQYLNNLLKINYFNSEEVG